MKTFMRSLSIFLVLCMLCSASCALAQETKNNEAKPPVSSEHRSKPKGEKFNESGKEMPPSPEANGVDHTQKPNGRGGRPNSNKENLKKLVDDGTISEEIYNAIITATQPDHSGESQEPGQEGISELEKPVFPEQEAIDQLYADGSITEDIYNVLSDLFRQKPSEIPAKE